MQTQDFIDTLMDCTPMLKDNRLFQEDGTYVRVTVCDPKELTTHQIGTRICLGYKAKLIHKNIHRLCGGAYEACRDAAAMIDGAARLRVNAKRAISCCEHAVQVLYKDTQTDTRLCNMG